MRYLNLIGGLILFSVMWICLLMIAVCKLFEMVLSSVVDWISSSPRDEDPFADEQI